MTTDFAANFSNAPDGSIPGSPYSQLVTELKELALLGSTMSVLGWDEQTFMPPGAAALRADQVSLLARMTHERHTGQRFADMLAGAEEEFAPQIELAQSPEGTSCAVGHRPGDAIINLCHIRKDFDRAAKLPSDFVEELSRTSVMAEQAWMQARRDDSFQSFQPWLEKIISLKQREAEYVGGGSGDVYDALLDEYEPGMTAARLRQVFDELRGPLVELVAAIRDSGRKAPVEITQRHFPRAEQEALSRRAAAAFGFDFTQGRLDVSAHPFCSFIGPGDTRMTTRYDENDISNAFFSVLHETGHGLYDQGLPADQFGLPLGDYVSLGIHESQSRLWENLVGRSAPFWQWMWPQFRAEFPDALGDVKLDDWMSAINHVAPSLVRTESDEITYNLHIVLRFELEQRLLSGEMPVADLPGEWNEAMKGMLGVCPESDANGCLQDIHWSGGAIGYFPTYTLGNLIAAQLFDAAAGDLRTLNDDIAAGDFSRLLGWLRKHVHSHGKRYSAEDLVINSTGRAVSAEPLLRHLRTKAATYYGV